MAQFKDIIANFFPAFAHACPHLQEHEMSWRIHFMIGSMAHTLADIFSLKDFSQGQCDPKDVQETTRQMIQYAAAGLRAPGLQAKPSTQKSQEQCP